MEENETLFTRVWKPLSSIRVLKTSRRSPGGKAQKEQYLLAVTNYQSQTPVEEAESRKGWTRGGVSAKMLGLEVGG